MANERKYSIVINGVEKSIADVNKLVAQLDELEKRMQALQGKNVSVGTGGGGKSSLSADDKLYKQILATEQKIEQTNEEDYKILLKKKAELKEIQKIQKSTFAEEQQQTKEYANTLNGQRQRLTDMKAALANMTIGSDGFNKQVKEIDALNEKIKEIEASFGQHSRNVGNYANSVAEGMTKLTIKVNGTDRTFNSAKQAAKELGNELKTMAVNGQQGTKEYQELDKTFKQLQSTIQDVSRSSAGMDKLLDTVQGLAAVGSVGRGLSSLFGFDDSRIGASIQKMMALQSVLQGIETIRKQMTTKEGLGAIFKEGSESIDQFVSKLTGARMGLQGLEMSSKSATYAVKGLSMAIKAFSTVLLIGAIEGAIETVKDLINVVKDWVGLSESSEDKLAKGMNEINTAYKQRIDLINASTDMNDSEKMVARFNAENDAIKKQIDLTKELNSTRSKLTDFAGDATTLFFTGRSWQIPYQAAKFLYDWKKEADTAKKSTKELEETFANFTGDFNKDTSDVLRAGQQLAKNWVSDVGKINLATVEGKQEFERLAKQLDDGSIYSSAMMNLHKLFPEGPMRDAIERTIEMVRNLSNAMNTGFNDFIRFIETPLDKSKRELEEYDRSLENYMYKMTPEQRDRALEKRRELEKIVENGGKAIVEKTKSAGGKATAAAAKTMDNLQSILIEKMKDGLTKTLRQIDLNAQKEIAELKLKGAERQQAELAIEEERQRKIEEAYKSHFDRILAMRKQLNDDLNNLMMDNLRETADLIARDTTAANTLESNRYMKEMSWGEKANFFLDLGDVATDGKRAATLMAEQANQLRQAAAEYENAVKSLKSSDFISEEEYENALQTRWELYQEQVQRIMNVDKKAVKETLDIIDELYKNRKRGNVTETGFDGALDVDTLNEIEQVLYDKLGYTFRGMFIDIMHDEFTDAVMDSLTIRKEYNDKVYQMELETNDKIYNAKKEEVEKEAQLQIDAAQEVANDKLGKTANPAIFVGTYGYSLIPEGESLKKAEQMYLKSLEKIKAKIATLTEDQVEEYKELYGQMGGELGEMYRNGEISFKEMLEKYLQYYTEYDTKIKNANKSKDVKLLEIDLDKLKVDSAAAIKLYNTTAEKISQDFQTISKRYGNGQVKDAFGILDIGKTKKLAKETKESLQILLGQLEQQFAELKSKFDLGRVFKEDYEKAETFFTNLIRMIKEKLGEVGGGEGGEGNGGNPFGDWWRSISDYAQQFVNGMSGILSELSNLYSAKYDALMDELEKESEALQEKYNEQEEIENRHKDNMQAISDEITTARGARREQLVDMYNAEIAAQRRAFAEKKRIEREERALDKKKDAEEKKERRRQNKINLAQMAMSQAMAIMNAYATAPWEKGLAMGILATVLTGIQMGLAIKAQKESEKYAEGGIIQGKSHAQGGVKVLGGQAEVEGGEFITNKRTTAKNADLLTFINSKNKRITPTDLNDFFTGKTNNRIKNNLKNKFASGGQLPATTVKKASNTIVVVDKSTPIVQVVDIVDATKRYNNVRVLAGLED